MIDMDGFKKLNDTSGHQVGDQLLVTAGKVIGANMRRMDVAARYGGDEFVLLLPHATTADAAQVAQRIREEFQLASAGALRRVTGVTMSVGISSIKDSNPPGADQLVAQADAALYKAKEAGRNCIATTSGTVTPPPPTPTQPPVVPLAKSA